jgi:aldose 1-epimerase
MASITSIHWGTGPDGKAVRLFTLRNNNGVETSITNYGGRIQTLIVPDRDGTFGDVVLGYDTLQEYLDHHGAYGAFIGRFGNRIAGAKFELGGNPYQLFANNGPNCLHGGKVGFHMRTSDARPIESVDGVPGAVALELRYLSADGEEGFPGNLEIKLTYTLTSQNALVIDYLATTDKDTVVNLTNHSYFNLAGAGNGDILGHELQISAGAYLPTDSVLIPTGELRPVAGTPFDFRVPHAIGERINSDDIDIAQGHGYDHNFVIRTKPKDVPELISWVRDPISGREMETWSTEPGVQLYTMNTGKDSVPGKSGKIYPNHGAFCLETQHFPDSPNQPLFPTTTLHPGDEYKSTTIYKFAVNR